MSLIFSKALKSGIFEVHDDRPECEFIHVFQVHGKDIVPAGEALNEADGITSQLSQLDRPLAIKTADCIPAVLEGSTDVVFLHAGWRGVALKIFEQKEIERIAPQCAYIGPCIHSCCYEVSSDFKLNFPESKNFTERDGKLYFNLPEEASDQIKRKYPHIKVEIDSQCTMCNSKFHSFRRNATKQRNWNLYRKGT